ncbi:hypothetical protein PR048_023148 [Dryococelus australis]|uniref:MADF domain-containing protein n=1 Tax=Dryococelus australis TaxID=614101 RepID=A0ABQ9GTC1_9NEOP|nr:hypothetical protein PR048_023148 [Dryococelus australis]
MAAVTTEREDIVEFLELYKEFGCLWDMYSKQYSNKDARNQALEILLEILKVIGNATIATVKKKIENIRAAYKRERKVKHMYIRSGREDIHVPTLWYYEYLTFLDEIYSVPRKGVDTLSTRWDDEDEDEEEESETQTQARRPPACKRRATNILKEQEDLIESANNLLSRVETPAESYGRAVRLQLK